MASLSNTVPRMPEVGRTGVISDSQSGPSAMLFRIGLALVTFEQVRPAGIMLSDYCFFMSIFAILPTFRSRFRDSIGSGILLGGALILAGSLLSLVNDSDLGNLGWTLARLFILYGLFAPLALIHSKDIRKNLLFVAFGISANCIVVIVQAWLFPGIVKLLSVNPQTQDTSEIYRYQGLTEFPVTLGLAAALSTLICFGLLLFEKRRSFRGVLIAAIFVSLQGAFLSGSRTFLAALLPALIVFALSVKQHRRIALQGIAALTVVGILALLLPGAKAQYSERIGEAGLIDIGRIAVAANAIIEISQRPILGWGANHFAEAGLTKFPTSMGYGDEPIGAHVTLLQYWYGGGLLVAIGFIILFLVPIGHMLQVLKRPQGNCTNAIRLMLACYVCIFIIFSLGPYLYNRYLYIPMFVFAGFTARVLAAANSGPSRNFLDGRQAKGLTTSH